MKKKLYIEFVYLLILGVITSFSLHPLNYFFINFLTFTLLFLFLIKKINQNINAKYFFIYGWLFGFSYFISNLYWISISLSFDQNFKFLIPFSLFLIPAGLAIFYGLVTYLFFVLKSKKLNISLLIFSLIFAILEFLRGSILTGFPWNLIVYSFSNQLEILSITSIIGTYGLNLFCILLFTSPALLILRKSSVDIFVFLFIILTPVLFYIYGLNYSKKFQEADKIVFDYKIRAIGSNIGIERFYSGGDTISIIEDLIQLSKPNINEKILFVWPEGIIPNTTQEQLKEYSELFNQKFSENHFLAIGINSQTIKNESKNYYNSLSVYDYELNLIDSYNKIKLVPFGEFLPLENILKRIGFKTITNNYQSYSKGDERNTIHIEKEKLSIRILPLICYEIIYSGDLFSNLNFDFIVNISEDGWFGKSIGPEQHFVHSIFRAIESGKYIVRSSNNGIAAIINPIGIIEEKVEFGNTGYVDLKENRKIQSTIFSKLGNKIFLIIILFYVLLIFLLIKLQKEKN